jgi:hypothetical protein
MPWWNRQPEDRARWVLDPLVGVGPLRFGMSPGQVEAALDDVAHISQGVGTNQGWQRYDETGITVIYGHGSRLAAVAFDTTGGPLVRLRDIELIGRVPSEVRSDLHKLAQREGATIWVNWSGDPEVATWGLSMGVTVWRASPGGFAERQDALLTDALVVGPELAEDPYLSGPVLLWRDARWNEPNPGPWPVKADRDRPRWDWAPLKGVGPLRFGMNPRQVAAALNGEIPAARNEHLRWPEHTDRFDQAGVTAHYWNEEG